MAEVAGIDVLVKGLHHPEGVATLPDGMLVCGSDDGRLYRGDPIDGSSHLLAERPGASFLGVCVDGDSGVLACDIGHREVVRWDGRDFDVLSAPSGGWSHPNALCFLADGRLVVSDSGRWSRPSGRIVILGPDSIETLDFGDLAFANGLCLDADGEQLWVVESARPRVSRIRLGPTGPEVTARIELPGCVPDGVAALVDGTVLVTCFRPDQVLHLGTSVEVLAADPTGLRLSAPTNLAFFGAGLTQAAVACFGAYHLAGIESPVAGATPCRPGWRPVQA